MTNPVLQEFIREALSGVVWTSKARAEAHLDQAVTEVLRTIRHLEYEGSDTSEILRVLSLLKAGRRAMRRVT